VRIEIPAKFLHTRRLQETLRLGLPVKGPVRGRTFIVALLGGTLAESAKIDDVAHSTSGTV
jgi:hypothetical protein